MEKYTIKSAFKMGEMHDTYGQSWYATVEELQCPVMFNLLSDQQVQEMDRVSFETQTVEKFKSGKNAGKEYRRLKKVKVEEGLPRIVTPDTVKESMVSTDIEARVVKLEEAVFGNKESENDYNIPPEFM
jgi:hypothetical protein